MIDKRFWARVDQSGGNDACWPWLGCKMPNGYGKVGRRGKTWLAHRYAYQYYRDSWQADLCVCHICDNRICCNPAHLFVGTQNDNLADMTAKGHRPRGDTHVNAKLSAEKVTRIRRFAYKGVSGKALANVFGVSRSVISNVLSGNAWGSV